MDYVEKAARGIFSAIILQALEDAWQGEDAELRHEARLWLQSNMARELFAALDLLHVWGQGQDGTEPERWLKVFRKAQRRRYPSRKKQRAHSYGRNGRGPGG